PVRLRGGGFVFNFGPALVDGHAGSPPMGAVLSASPATPQKRDARSMNRRMMLKGAAAALSVVPLAGAARGAPFRRGRPGGPRGASPAAWEELGRALGGNLIKPAPLLAPCGAGGDRTGCD